METTRRSFIGNVSLLAAGAGIGIPIAAGAPKRVITEVKMMLFSKDPIAIKATIHSDEDAGVFMIDMPDLKARMPLSDVRDVTQYWQRSFNVVLTSPKETNRLSVRAYVDVDRFCIEEDKADSAPCWISLSDVQKAVASTA